MPVSVYDSAGSALVAEIAGSYDATRVQLSFSLDTLGWLLKTHLNNIRAARDSATGEKYLVDPATYRALLTHVRVPDDHYCLFVEGWAGAEYFWDPEHSRRIPYLSYRTVRDLDFDILISDVRIKWLDTVVLLPRNGNHADFKLRAQLTAAKVTRTLGFKWESVDIDSALENHALRIHDPVETDTLVRSIRQVRGWQRL